MPARNGSWKPKPAERTGLWGSRINDPDGWKAWCEENNFLLDHLKCSFRFQLNRAKILTLSSPTQLIPLPKLHPWEPKAPLSFDTFSLPSEDQLESWYVPNYCYLDYEKLASQYDAIELRNHWLFQEALATWDCNCIWVLKADVLQEVNESSGS